MGDRGNIVVQADAEVPAIYLYTHWNGSEMGETLRSALKRCPDRWNDATYLTRCIFCEMVRGAEMMSTGFGIGTHPPDNEHDFLYVDVHEQMISWKKSVHEKAGPRSWSFEAFVDDDTDIREG